MVLDILSVLLNNLPLHCVRLLFVNSATGRLIEINDPDLATVSHNRKCNVMQDELIKPNILA